MKFLHCAMKTLKLPVLVQSIRGRVVVRLLWGMHCSISLLETFGLSRALIFVTIIESLNIEEGHNCENITLGLF